MDTLNEQCPMSNSSGLFSYTTICSSFKWIEPLFYPVHRQTHNKTDTQTPTHTDKHMYSIVGVDKPQL